jgi:hypothetical protein
MQYTSKDLLAVWRQTSVPVIIRRNKRGQQHRLRIPFAANNRDWLRNGRRISPVWISPKKYWEIPKAWFNDFINRSLKKYGQIWIIQPFREQEVCAPACMNALGHDCQCSCMGMNHGSGNDGSWFEVNEAFATRWDDEEWACRLLSQR